MMKRIFLLALTAILCLSFAGNAISNQIIEGFDPEPPKEYLPGYTDDYVIINYHAWLGGPDAVVTTLLGIGYPLDINGGLIYDPGSTVVGSLTLVEDDSFPEKTVGELTVDGDLKMGGGVNSEADLFIPVGSVTANSIVDIGLGYNAYGAIHVQGGSFTLGSSAEMRLGHSDEPFTTRVSSLGNGFLNISGGSVTAPAGSSLIVGALGNGTLAVQGTAITAINIYNVDVTDKGRVEFTLDSGVSSPDVKTINSAGHFYLEDGSIIDMDFVDQVAETVMSSYDEAASERVVSLITSSDLKWNETGYNVALSPEDAPGWILSEDSGTLKAQYLGGTGSDLIINTGTELSPTPISPGLYRNIFVAYGVEASPVVVGAEGHASINDEVACSADLTLTHGINCTGSLTIGSGGSLNIFAGEMNMGIGDYVDATLTLEDDGELSVMYDLMMAKTEGTLTYQRGTRTINISDTAKLQARNLLLGDYLRPVSVCIVNQAGGSVELREDLCIGLNSTSGSHGGVYAISGGELNVGDGIFVGQNNETTLVSDFSLLSIDGSDPVVTAKNFSLATYCTLRFTIDEGPDYEGGITPIDLTGNGNEGFAYFHSQYLDEYNIDPDNSCIIDMAFAPGAESLVASLPVGDPKRGFDIVLADTWANLKWQANDTHISVEGYITDHKYGLKFSNSNWVMSEITQYSPDRRGDYASLRAYYIGPQTPVPTPTADAGPNQTEPTPRVAVMLDGSGSSATPGRSIVSYKWSWQVGSDVYTIEDTDAQAPSYFMVGSHTVTLTVTDDAGHSDTDTCVVTITSPHRPGDVNNDGLTNLTDFVILRNNFGDCDPDIP